jgi:tetratricopeptide (TPR) repeat protein
VLSPLSRNIGVEAGLLAMLGAVVVFNIGCGGESDVETDGPRVDIAARATYVGRENCIRCHEHENRMWEGSHHDLAMQEATERTVRGDFDEASFSYNGVTSTFFKRDGRFFVRTDGPDGELHDYQIAYTFGAIPLQQYLIEFPGGRYQALPICWDTRPADEGGQRWFHLYPDEELDHRDPLHWTGIYQNWNYMCAECHSTNLRKSYRLEEDRYETSWSELDVSCEACHGPGSEHVAWGNAVTANVTPPFEHEHMGLVVRLEDPGRGTWTISPETGSGVRLGLPTGTWEMETCARCHSRRGVISEDYRFERPLLDTHRLALLEEGLYHADGQILEEVYVHGSFLQSKMFLKGVTCSDCHDPHNLELHFPGDAVCFRCHSQKIFATPDHHFHKPDSAGSFCVDCHMPPKNYMVVDPRHDHSLRVPRPDLSLKLGTTDACSQCHADKPIEWSVDAVANWYGNDRRAEPGYGEALHAGRAGLPEAEAALVGLADDPEMTAIVRATALHLLQRYLTPTSLATVERSLAHDDPLVRSAALRALEPTDTQTRLRLATPLLADPVRLVRLEAARVIAPVPDAMLSGQQKSMLAEALEEYRQAQIINADRAEGHLNLGWLHAVRGDLGEAETAFEKAKEAEPYFVPAYVNLADVYRQQGREQDAESILREALEVSPDSADVYHALGLVLVRQRRQEEALAALAKAAELQPEEPRYAFVYGVALHDVGRPAAALEVLTAAHRRHPSDRELLWTLAVFSREQGDSVTATEYARKLVELAPQDPRAQQLLRELEAGAG